MGVLKWLALWVLVLERRLWRRLKTAWFLARFALVLCLLSAACGPKLPRLSSCDYLWIVKNNGPEQTVTAYHELDLVNTLRVPEDGQATLCSAYDDLVWQGESHDRVEADATRR